MIFFVCVNFYEEHTVRLPHCLDPSGQMNNHKRGKRVFTFEKPHRGDDFASSSAIPV